MNDDCKYTLTITVDGNKIIFNQETIGFNKVEVIGMLSQLQTGLIENSKIQKEPINQ